MMNIRRLPLLALALLPLALAPSLDLAAQSSTGPKAVVPKTVLDLGQHPRGSKLETNFKVQNQGTEPLTILDTGSSCACMVVAADTEIAPGGTGEVTLAIDTEVLEGASRVTAAILTNDPTNPKILLQVNLESVPYLAAKPGFFHYTVYRGFQERGEIAQTVVADNPREFTIERVESTVPALDVSFRAAEPAERIAGFEGPQYRVIGVLDPDVQVGPLTGFVRVHTTHEKQKLFSIPVSGFVRPVVAVTPPRLDFGTFSIPEDEDRYGTTLRVQHFLEKAEALQITKIETDIPNLESELHEGQTDHDWFLDLWFDKDSAPSGKFNGTVKLHTTSELAPIVEFTVRGERV
ncbi:MAG TPA: DUF1573 domain-containing protein [Thermoanaerobaculia bacterium]|nr:DUF1573 domain-containing protein [Thermoanaerobaculia bacterium]